MSHARMTGTNWSVRMRVSPTEPSSRDTSVLTDVALVESQ